MIACTWGTEIKLAPNIVICVAVLGGIVKVVDDIVGLVSPIVTLPPKATPEPLIVIELLANFVVAIAAVALISAFKIAPSKTFPVVIASSKIFTVVTELLASLSAVIIPFEISLVVKAALAGIVSLFIMLR